MRADSTLENLIKSAFSLSNPEKNKLLADLPQMSDRDRQIYYDILSRDQSDYINNLAALSPVDLVSPEEITKLAPSQFNQDWLSRLELTLREYQETNELGLLKEIYDFLQDKLKKTGHELLANQKESFQKLQILLKRIKIFLLPNLSKEEVEEALRGEEIVVGLRDMDLKQKIKDYLDFHHDDLIGWSYRSGALTALRANQNIIGGGKEWPAGDFEPTIAGWLRDYDRAAPSQKPRGNLERLNYLNRSDYVKKISQEERHLLTEILEIYDFLRYQPSDSLVVDFIASGGRWDEKGEPVTITRPPIIKPARPFPPPKTIPSYQKPSSPSKTRPTPSAKSLTPKVPLPEPPKPKPVPPSAPLPEKPPAAPSPPQPEIPAKPPVPTPPAAPAAPPKPVSPPKPVAPVKLSDSEEQSVYLEEGKIKEFLKTRTLPKVFVEALVQGNKLRAAACLKTAAVANELKELIIDPEVLKLFSNYLQSKYGEAYVLAFKTHPEKERYRKEFLSWALRKAGFDEGRALAWGKRIDTIIKG